jgi:hypothetical protein
MAHEAEYDREEPDDYRECCDACGGDGFYHDCGDDTCCCLNPDTDDLVNCDECGGSGHV